MNQKFLRNSTFLFGIAVFLIVVPALCIKNGIINGYWAQVLTSGGVYALLALSVNVVCGITGQLSLGQAGFAAIGAYSVIFLTSRAGLPLALSIVCAGLIAAFFGFLIGFPTLKLEGDYLAIVTLAFGEIIKVVLLNQKDLTGGPNGMEFLTYFTANLKMGPFVSYISITGTLVLVVVLLQNFLRSTYGRAIMAVREDEIAANSNGISIFRYKMIGFIIAAFIGGIGGALYAPLIGFVKPEFADFNHSVNYLIYVVLGGMGSTTGSIIAAYMLTILQEYLRILGSFRQLFYPLILIVVMLFRPQGLLGTKELSFVKLLEKSIAGFKKNSKKRVQFLLRAQDISIVFGGLRAVSDFSLDLYKGELVGLIGPNGAGKTTVFNMLSGIYTPTSGTITFVDKNGKLQVINKKSPAQLNRLGIARTFQNIRLFGALSVIDNIKIALHQSRRVNPIDVLLRLGRFHKDENRMNEKALRLLKLFNLEAKADEFAKNLPYGEQRKLEICRALASGPKLLLLDEPAAGMNDQETHELMEMIAFIRDEFNLTVLLIEHDMKLVMGICERLLVLNYGSVIAKGLPQEIQADENVITAYLGSGYKTEGQK